MQNRTVEIGVGLFLLAGILALLLLALRVSGLSASPTADTYKLYAYFDNIAGLTVRSKVTMAGVTIGKVTAIDLDRDSFTGRVTMQLDKKARGALLRFVVLEDLGRPVSWEGPDPALLAAAYAAVSE